MVNMYKINNQGMRVIIITPKGKAVKLAKKLGKVFFGPHKGIGCYVICSKKFKKHVSTPYINITIIPCIK